MHSKYFNFCFAITATFTNVSCLGTENFESPFDYESSSGKALLFIVNNQTEIPGNSSFPTYNYDFSVVSFSPPTNINRNVTYLVNFTIQNIGTIFFCSGCTVPYRVYLSSDATVNTLDTQIGFLSGNNGIYGTSNAQNFSLNIVTSLSADPYFIRFVANCYPDGSGGCINLSENFTNNWSSTSSITVNP